jgi:hypothetical protein
MMCPFISVDVRLCFLSASLPISVFLYLVYNLGFFFKKNFKK